MLRVNKYIYIYMTLHTYHKRRKDKQKQLSISLPKWANLVDLDSNKFHIPKSPLGEYPHSLSEHLMHLNLLHNH
jgi:hypothetical protein